MFIKNFTNYKRKKRSKFPYIPMIYWYFYKKKGQNLQITKRKM